MNQTPADKLAGTFCFQKYEALCVSGCAFYLWLSTAASPGEPEWLLLFSRAGMPFLVMFLIGLTSWRMNLRAESSLAFKTGHCLYYAIHAAIQDCIMTLCVGTFALYAIFHFAAAIWFIIACAVALTFFIWRFRKANRIIRWSLDMKALGIAAPEESAPDNTIASLLCMLARYVAIGYTIYYIFTT